MTHKICTFFIAIKTYPNTRQQIVYIRNGDLRRRQVTTNSGGFAFAHGSREGCMKIIICACNHYMIVRSPNIIKRREWRREPISYAATMSIEQRQLIYKVTFLSSRIYLIQ